MEVGRFGWTAALALLALGAGGGCTAKYRKELEERNRELRTVREERDDLRAQVDELKAKERLYQDQLGALKSAGAAKPREAGGSPEPVPSRTEEKARAIAADLKDTGVETDLREGRIVLTLPASITFASGQAILTGKGKEALRKVAASLKAQYKAGRIWVEGHTDNEPIKKSKFPSNRALSLARAGAVADFLTKEAGVPDRRLVYAGYGEWNPIADNASATGRERNRRVELLLDREE
ncbi:MAG TPA: OmpA family protein [Planctomycetota bacterium]|jgi:chemotaxis protein MotB|nr:OmpA family protein [Planctomycetota bacterium]